MASLARNSIGERVYPGPRYIRDPGIPGPRAVVAVLAQGYADRRLGRPLPSADVQSMVFTTEATYSKVFTTEATYSKVEGN